MAPGKSSLKPSYRNVLAHLSAQPDGAWVPQQSLPDGKGFNTCGRCARGEVLREMRQSGWIEYGKEPQHSLYGYRITPEGKRALAEAVPAEA